MVQPLHSKRPLAVVSWDPRLPPSDPFQQKHWHPMEFLDPYLKQVFPEPPVRRYKRPKNIREYLIRAKLPPPNEKRQTKAFKGKKDG